MKDQHSNPPLLGYGDALSGRPGDTIEFKVSSTGAAPVAVHLVRSISADPNPAGQGIVEEDASDFFAPMSFASQHQPFFPGSYARASADINVAAQKELTLQARVFPTRLGPDRQTILSLGQIDLALDEHGLLVLSDADTVLCIGAPVAPRVWTLVTATLTPSGVTLCAAAVGDDAPHTDHATSSVDLAVHAAPTIAARDLAGRVTQHFNGKIEAPEIHVDGQPHAVWDFAKDISTNSVPAQCGPDLTLFNSPTRAVTGSNWDATEMNWTHKPDHYGAIHFHDDDIYDFGWDTSFRFTIPDDMPCGIYIMRLACDGAEDAIPFYVSAPLGKPKAKLCVLISTFTYVIYGNHARPDYAPSWQDRIDDWGAYPHNPANHTAYGLSTYNYHSDGSGICHASHRRPLFNLRPGYLTFGQSDCSGLRHLQADSHLISWLHAKGIDYDIVTDIDLHRDGVAAIASYDVVTTGSHPEYHTSQTLDALRDYRDSGGHLLYLGANGFYWRIALHPEDESLLEIRRAEDGIRAWAAEPGEYYNAFDGTYGGLWRRNARAPQQLVGIGFSAQGEFVGDPYRRVCNDPEFDWVFAGIEDDIIGDFGFSGGGAAGFELDHMDHRLGTPENTVLLARSVTRDEEFMLVPEEQLTHLTNLTGGPEKEALHADMIYFDVPGGGSVFATGSITFCGCLPWNNFENNVSTLLKNVLDKKLNTHRAA